MSVTNFSFSVPFNFMFILNSFIHDHINILKYTLDKSNQIFENVI